MSPVSATALPPIVLNTGMVRRTSLAEKVVLAGRNGFSGLEMWAHEVVPHVLSADDLREGADRFEFDPSPDEVDAAALAALLAAHRLTIDGIIPGSEVLRRWSSTLDDDLITRLDTTMRACRGLGGRYLVMPTIADHGTLEQVAGNLRELGPLARQHGVRLGLEPVGQTPVVRGVREALMVLDRAGLDEDAGIILDAFHFFRAGQKLSELMALAPERIITVQINDAIERPIENLLGHRHREFPGQGRFDVAGFCATVLGQGYGGTFTVEVLNPVIWSAPADEVCRRAWRTSASVLSQALGCAPPATESDVA